MMTTLERPRTIAALTELLGGTDQGLTSTTSLTGLADDSRRVEAGHVFFARRGSEADGATFAADAVSRGAVVIVAEDELGADLPVLRVASVDEALERAADAWYGRPQDDLDLLHRPAQVQRLPHGQARELPRPRVERKQARPSS